MTLAKFISPKLRVLKYGLIFILMLMSGAVSAQVLEPLGAGLPSRVVAAYAAGNEYLALFADDETPDTSDYIVARWNGAYWSYFPGLYKPNAVRTVDGNYNYNSVVLYRDTMYVGAFISGSKRDADEDVSHLYKWNGNRWENDLSVIKSRNDGIVAMTVFDGKLIVAGKFHNSINGKKVDNIAAFDGNTGKWDFLGSNDGEQGTDGTIRCLQASGNRLYIAGDFQQFAGALTGNIAYYTASNGGWGGIGSPFGLRVDELASYNGKLAALGMNSYHQVEIREFDGQWSQPVSFADFQQAAPRTIAGAGDILLIGGSFILNDNGTSVLRLENGKLYSTGNRIIGYFKLGQRGDHAFIWGSYKEQNTGLSNINRIETNAGEIAGYLFFDKDQNCIFGHDDVPLKMISVRFTEMSSGKSYFTVSGPDGRFAAALPEGNYNIDVFPGRHWINPCSGNYASSVQRGMYSFVSLGQYMAPNISDLEVHSAALMPPQLNAGDKIRIAVTVKNTGSAAINGQTLHFRHSLRLGSFSSDPEPANYANGDATYSLTSLEPFSSRTFLITMSLPADANESDRFGCEIKTGTQFTALDAYQPDNYDTVTVQLQNKGKAAVIKSGLNGEKVDKTVRSLTYHVDFTNTGNSMVKRLVMLDTVDVKLPMARVKIDGLYPAEANIRTEKGNILVVEYPNANLSTFEANPAFASGYMRYSIELKSDLRPGDYIYNRASGDFESRWKASSNMVTVLVNNPSAGMRTISTEFATMSPNPVADLLNIQFREKQTGQVVLYSLNGKVMSSQVVNGIQLKVNTAEIPPGIYLIKTPAGSAKIQISH